MVKRFVIRYTDDGWYIYDKQLHDLIEGYGTDRGAKTRAYHFACYYNRFPGRA